MKRFYKMVSVAQAPGGFEIHLDGRPINTQVKHVLCAPTQSLAEAIMGEWAAQETEIIPDSMPLTQILSTKIDRVSAEREAMSAYVFKYLDTDLLCYRAEEPPELKARQEALWSPHLEWFTGQFGAALEVTNGLAALAQDEAAHEAAQEYVAGLDADRFTVLQLVCSLSGSLVLALAFVEGATDADQVFAAARVEEHYKDEIFNAEKHGPDPAQDKKDKAVMRDLEAAQTYLKFLGQ